MHLPRDRDQAGRFDRLHQPPVIPTAAPGAGVHGPPVQVRKPTPRDRSRGPSRRTAGTARAARPQPAFLPPPAPRSSTNPRLPLPSLLPCGRQERRRTPEQQRAPRGHVGRTCRANLEQTLWLPDTRGHCGSGTGACSSCGVPPLWALFPQSKPDPWVPHREAPRHCTLGPLSSLLLFLNLFLPAGLAVQLHQWTVSPCAHASRPMPAPDCAC